MIRIHRLGLCCRLLLNFVFLLMPDRVLSQASSFMEKKFEFGDCGAEGIRSFTV